MRRATRSTAPASDEGHGRFDYRLDIGGRRVDPLDDSVPASGWPAGSGTCWDIRKDGSARDAPRGFTLVELLIGIVDPRDPHAARAADVSASSANARIRNTADSLANGIRLAQVEAIRRNRNVSSRSIPRRAGRSATRRRRPCSRAVQRPGRHDHRRAAPCRGDQARLLAARAVRRPDRSRRRHRRITSVRVTLDRVGGAQRAARHADPAGAASRLRARFA